MSIKNEFNDPTPHIQTLWDALQWTHAYRFVEGAEKEREGALKKIADFLSRGADVHELGEKTGDYQYAPFEYAVLVMQDTAVAQALLAYGANINRQDIYGNTALHNVVIYAQPVFLLDFLIDNGADVAIKNIHGENAAACLEKTIARFKKDDFPYKIHGRERLAAAASQPPKSDFPKL